MNRNYRLYISILSLSSITWSSAAFPTTGLGGMEGTGTDLGVFFNSCYSFIYAFFLGSHVKGRLKGRLLKWHELIAAFVLIICWSPWLFSPELNRVTLYASLIILFILITLIFLTTTGIKKALAFTIIPIGVISVILLSNPVILTLNKYEYLEDNYIIPDVTLVKTKGIESIPEVSNLFFQAGDGRIFFMYREPVNGYRFVRPLPTNEKVLIDGNSDCKNNNCYHAYRAGRADVKVRGAYFDFQKDDKLIASRLPPVSLINLPINVVKVDPFHKVTVAYGDLYRDRSGYVDNTVASHLLRMAILKPKMLGSRIEELLLLNADPNYKSVLERPNSNREEFPTFYLALEHSGVSVVRQLLDFGADAVLEVTSKGYSGVYSLNGFHKLASSVNPDREVSSLSSTLDKIELLAARGVSIAQRNNKGESIFNFIVCENEITEKFMLFKTLFSIDSSMSNDEKMRLSQDVTMSLLYWQSQHKHELKQIEKYPDSDLSKKQAKSFEHEIDSLTKISEFLNTGVFLDQPERQSYKEYGRSYSHHHGSICNRYLY